MAYWTLEGIYRIATKVHVLTLVDEDGEGDILGTDDDGGPNNAYNRVVEAGDAADRLIDSYLRGHYDLPLSPVPAEIPDHACALAVVELYNRSDYDELPKKISGLKKTTIDWLKDVRDDKIRLTTDEAPTTVIHVNKTSDDQAFPSSVLDQF